MRRFFNISILLTCCLLAFNASVGHAGHEKNNDEVYVTEIALADAVHIDELMYIDNNLYLVSNWYGKSISKVNDAGEVKTVATVFAFQVTERPRISKTIADDQPGRRQRVPDDTNSGDHFEPAPGCRASDSRRARPWRRRFVR